MLILSFFSALLKQRKKKVKNYKTQFVKGIKISLKAEKQSAEENILKYAKISNKSELKLT